MPKLTKKQIEIAMMNAYRANAGISDLMFDVRNQEMDEKEATYADIFSKHHNELVAQMEDLLAGPATMETSDLVNWVCNNYMAYQVFTGPYFTNVKLPYPELLEVHFTLERSGALGLMHALVSTFTDNEYEEPEEDAYQMLDFSDEELNLRQDEGEDLSQDPELYFDDDEDLMARFNRVKENANKELNYNPNVKQFENSIKKVTSVDDIIDDLDAFRKELKETDPWWIATNSDEFRKLKESLNSTISTLQGYRNQPDKMDMQKVEETLKKLSEQASEYSKRKQKEFETSKKSRDEERGDIAGRLGAYLGNGKAIREKLSGVASEYVKVNSKIAGFYGTVANVYEGKMDYFTKSRGEIVNEVRAMVDLFKTLPQKGSKKQKEMISLEVATLFKEIGMDESKKFVEDSAFDAVRDDLVKIAKAGGKLIKEKKAEALQNEIKAELVEPATQKMAGAQGMNLA